MSPVADSDHRQAFITGLRDLARYLARHPAIPVPRHGTEIVLTADSTDDGGCTQVKVYVRKVRDKEPPTPSLETPDYGPGEMAESGEATENLGLGTSDTPPRPGNVLVLPPSAERELAESDESLGTLGRPFDRRMPFFVGLTGTFGVAVSNTSGSGKMAIPVPSR